jgi:hydrogenase nickel incorporation protein HypA/HybF
MHELSVTQSLLEIALRHAQQVGAQKITVLNLVVGQLASIVDDSVQFYWEIVSQGTLAEHAQLHFTRLPAEFECRECQTHFPLNGKDFACPQCQSTQVRIVQGEEFHLESIEVES